MRTASERGEIMNRIGFLSQTPSVGQAVLYEVDFCVKIKGNFRTLHSAFLEAISISECFQKATELSNEIPHLKNENVQIYISD